MAERRRRHSWEESPTADRPGFSYEGHRCKHCGLYRLVERTCLGYSAHTFYALLAWHWRGREPFRVKHWESVHAWRRAPACPGKPLPLEGWLLLEQRGELDR